LQSLKSTITLSANRLRLHPLLRIACLLLDNITEPSLTKTLTKADTDASVIDDDTDGVTDDEEDNDEDNQAMSVTSELDSSRWRPTDKSKHLVLLDLLALLLVTGPKSDVAVTMLITNGSMKFFYSKNRPFEDSENEYVHRLFDYASNTNSLVGDRYTALMAEIIDKCQQKIKSRISKVLRRVKELPTNRGIHSEDCLPLELVEKLKENLQLDPEDSLRLSLIDWFDRLSSAQAAQAAQLSEELRYAIVSAHVLGISPGINLLIDQKLLRRIRKLGDYMGAVIRLVGEINRLSRVSPDVLENLDIQEVRTEITDFCTV
jgi:hypothetical protein